MPSLLDERTRLAVVVIFAWAGACVWANVSRAQVPAATDEAVRFFESRVRPIFVDRCLKCHGAEKQEGGLRLDRRESLLSGGESGPAIMAGKPGESLLIRVVRHEDKKLKMHEGGMLSDVQIADLVRWVETGAAVPEAVNNERRLRDPNHWAFQPLTAPKLPESDRSATDAPTAGPVESPIDLFVLAKLRENRLSFAPRADKRALIRRATFDLTGLPPTPEAVATFVADERPEAFARLVDELLATPAYGERWGRHWLDVARYADSNGLDENVCHGNAWRYRDYVVAAMNADKPIDRFIVEQIAGDLLPFDNESQQHEQLIATGFLTIGPKVLAETDEAKMRMDIIDEQVDTVGRAFLGMTLGCARCHDHKFDPISTADYYGLAGIFKSTKTMDKYTKIAHWHENVLPSAAATAIKDEYDLRVQVKETALAEFIATADKLARETLAKDPDAKPPEKLETVYPDATKAELKKLRDELAEVKKAGPDLPAAMGVAEDTIVDLAIHVRGNPLNLGDVVPRHTPEVVKGPATPQFVATESGRRQFADWLVDPQNPLTARVFVNRVWRWHFGRGIVRTTDNFGMLGEQPSHPELLDWLARRFVADGWSLKSLHRLILNSATYQQGSLVSAETRDRDSENRLFGRAELRRLDAESLRDSWLAVAGDLDRSMGGSLLKVKNREFFFDHTSKDLTTYDSRRRSLYLPVVRNNVYDLFQILDFPDPALSVGDRKSTTVAPQSLLMMNSDLVMQCAEELAGRLVAEPLSDDERLTRLYQTAFAREPSDAELRADTAFVVRAEQALQSAEPDAAQRRSRAWGMLCHVVLTANEFVYVR